MARVGQANVLAEIRAAASQNRPSYRISHPG